MTKVPRFVYFMKPVGMDGPIKIGCSDVPERRLAGLSAWSPFPLEILVTTPGGFKLEANLHDCFFPQHTHREWFNPCPELLAGIEALKAGVPVEVAFNLAARKGSIRGGPRQQPWPEGRRLYMGWTIRMHALCKRMQKTMGEPYWLPSYAIQIIDDLRENPHDAEGLAKLQAIVADPTTHLQTREQRQPSKVAA